MRRTARLTGALRGRTAAVTLAGAALAMAGTGTAAAATFAPASHAHSAPASRAHSAPARTASVSTAQAAAPAPAGRAAPARAAASPAPARAAAPAPARAAAPQAAPTWGQIERMVARQTSPSEPRAASWLTPVGTSGPQAWMPISADQMANATTIVQQALARGMGIRSAVIAVATSMQEAQLHNLNYGDSDSLGLFQQRPSAGWGTAQQILTPQYAADAFLTALQQHQASDPGWATQPLWANAQAVQNSGFPFAYAKWENQAASMVRQIVTQVR